MMQIGIEENQNLVYEGISQYGRAIWPAPVITSAKFVLENEGAWEASANNEPVGGAAVFREDSFDPTTRLRRGRFYFIEGPQPAVWHLQPHPAIHYEAGVGTEGEVTKPLKTYVAQPLSSKLPGMGRELPVVLLGIRDRFTAWMIISIEAISTGEDLVTLKARGSLGILPKMKEGAIPKGSEALIRETLDAFADEVYRASPISVIDRARDAISQCLLVYFELGAEGAKDLGKLVKCLSQENLQVASNAANIVARLHARAKPVEKMKRDLRPIRQKDADLATQCVGTILCEIGWADWA